MLASAPVVHHTTVSSSPFESIPIDALILQCFDSETETERPANADNFLDAVDIEQDASITSELPSPEIAQYLNEFKTEASSRHTAVWRWVVFGAVLAATVHKRDSGARKQILEAYPALAKHFERAQAAVSYNVWMMKRSVVREVFPYVLERTEGNLTILQNPPLMPPRNTSVSYRPFTFSQKDALDFLNP
jgi:hypothetical protein